MNILLNGFIDFYWYWLPATANKQKYIVHIVLLTGNPTRTTWLRCVWSFFDWQHTTLRHCSYTTRVTCSLLHLEVVSTTMPSLLVESSVLCSLFSKSLMDRPSWQMQCREKKRYWEKESMDCIYTTVTLSWLVDFLKFNSQLSLSQWGPLFYLLILLKSIHNILFPCYIMGPGL